MPEGYLCKDYQPLQTDQQEMELINRYSRRTLSPEEVYRFTVVLCDNDIDRDYERFTKDALEILSTLYVGKTGIFDHSMKSQHQAARIFSCRVEPVPSRMTQDQEPYFRLVARAYVPRLEKNADLIAELDSGIKKEVSVGCAMGQATCSICGADLRKKGCRHEKGKLYGGKLCHTVLDSPTDAYEWSFVAVPAQREAGVVKNYRPQIQKEEPPMEQWMSQLREGKACRLSESQCQDLYHAWKELEELAQEGKQYREELRKEVVRMSAAVCPGISPSVMEGLSSRMSLSELQVFRKAYSSQLQRLDSPVPQLAPQSPPKGTQAADSSFLI